MLENNPSISVYRRAAWFHCAINMLALDIENIVERERAMTRKTRILIDIVSKETLTNSIAPLF